MIRIVTDSGSMLTPELRARFDVHVVPMAVIVDGRVYHEGVDLDTTEFYARLAGGATVTTSAPSPGDLLQGYQHAFELGATEVLSIHTGANYSATVSAATLAAAMAPLPVTVIDTGAASFAVSLCLWAASDSLARGVPASEAANAARRAATRVGSVFVVGVPQLALDGGRFTAITGELSPTSVLELGPAGLRALTDATDINAALDAMVTHVAALAASGPVRLAVGDADRPKLATELADRLSTATNSAQVTRYEVGPSVGAHTGPGSVGVVYCSLELDVNAEPPTNGDAQPTR